MNKMADLKVRFSELDDGIRAAGDKAFECSNDIRRLKQDHEFWVNRRERLADEIDGVAREMDRLEGNT